MPKNDATPSQLEFFEIPSPCIGVCQSGPRGFCKGCYRSRDERLYWLKVEDDTKRHILKACRRRKASALRKNRKQKNSSLINPSNIQQDFFSD